MVVAFEAYELPKLPRLVISLGRRNWLCFQRPRLTPSDDTQKLRWRAAHLHGLLLSGLQVICLQLREREVSQWRRWSANVSLEKRTSAMTAIAHTDFVSASNLATVPRCAAGAAAAPDGSGARPYFPSAAAKPRYLPLPGSTSS